jgi:peptidoglycan/LPS O-acetylase OafA/YrhL
VVRINQGDYSMTLDPNNTAKILALVCAGLLLGMTSIIAALAGSVWVMAACAVMVFVVAILATLVESGNLS